MNENLLTLFIAVTAIAVVIQMGVLIGIFVAMKKTAGRVESLVSDFHGQAMPLLASAKNILSDAEPKLKTITADMAETAAKLRSQVQRIDVNLTDALDRARLQVVRADELLSQTLDKVEETTEVVQRSVVAPVRYATAMMAGLSTGIGTFFGRAARKPTTIRGTMDEEELFI